MIHILIAIFSIFTIEIIRYFKLFNKLQNTLITSKKIFHIVITKKISDHWKEKVILKYSQLLLLSSLQIIGIFALILIIYFIFSYLNFTFSNYLLSILGIIETSAIVLIYLYIKKLIYAKL